MDTKDYLQQLIDHYHIILSSNKLSELNSFIQEEQRTCLRKLRQLKELDMEATLMANASVSRFLHTNYI